MNMEPNPNRQIPPADNLIATAPEKPKEPPAPPGSHRMLPQVERAVRQLPCDGIRRYKVSGYGDKLVYSKAYEYLMKDCRCRTAPNGGILWTKEGIRRATALNEAYSAIAADFIKKAHQDAFDQKLKEFLTKKHEEFVELEGKIKALEKVVRVDQAAEAADCLTVEGIQNLGKEEADMLQLKTALAQNPFTRDAEGVIKLKSQTKPTAPGDQPVLPVKVDAAIV